MAYKIVIRGPELQQVFRLPDSFDEKQAKAEMIARCRDYDRSCSDHLIERENGIYLYFGADNAYKADLVTDELNMQESNDTLDTMPETLTPLNFDTLQEDYFGDFLLTDAVKKAAVEFLNFLLNRRSFHTRIPYNILFTSELPARAEYFLSCFRSVIDHALGVPGSVGMITEDMFLRGDSRFPKNQVLIVSSCSFEQLDRWMERAVQLTANGELTILAATDNAGKDRLKADDHLFHRVFSGHINLPDPDRQDIQHILYRRFAAADLSTTEAFEAGLKQYLEVVYPKADLRWIPFAEDLYARVLRTQLSVPVPGRQIDENCIPYYEKPAQPAAAKTAQSAKEKSGQFFGADEISKFDKKAFGESPAVRALSENGERRTSVLLVALSTFPQTMTETTFHVRFDKNAPEKVPGLYQLDPVPNYLKSIGKTLDFAILLATPETCVIKEIQVKDSAQVKLGTIKKSPLEYFKEKLAEVMPKPRDDQRIVEIKVDTDNLPESFSDTLSVLRILRKGGDIDLYMDTHGGPRSTQLTLEALLSLEDREHIHTTAFDVRYNYGNPENNEIFPDKGMEMFSFVSGMNEFLNYGRMASLRADGNNGISKKLLDSIDRIATGIQWCNTNVFEQGIVAMKQYFSQNHEPSKNNYLRLFEDQIEADYGELLKGENSDGKFEFDAGQAIRWCIRKQFYQQALTILESRIWRTLGKNGIINFNMNKVRDVSEKDIFDGCVFNCFQPGGKHYLADYAAIRRALIQTFENEKNRTPDEMLKVLAANIPCRERMPILLTNARTTSKLSRGVSTSYPDAITFVNNKKTDPYYLVLFALHKLLKDIRNNTNHVSEDNNYEPDSIRNAILVYLELIDVLTEKVGNLSGKK